MFSKKSIVKTKTCTLEQVYQALEQSKVGLIPTETLWGLTCNPFSLQAVSKLFQLKQRAWSKSVPLVAGSIEQVLDFVVLSEKMLKFLKQFWPGPLSVIGIAKKRFVSPMVVNKKQEVCIRVTSHPELTKLCLRCGYPLVATSANISNKPSPRSFEQIDAVILEGVDFIFRTQNHPIGDKPSTIITFQQDKLIILRKGALDEKMLLSSWQKF
ncbi:MAG: L-threonylcarbamoyladenylate synthase [Desulfonauticus sp.]|nr:L-threonylcarbamoyladenylate synthase [Desulfonauticus sp.]